MTQYQHRFVSIVHYIEAHLDEPLDIDRLCQQACLSRYHFHRQCSAFFGMSVISLVRLLRLKRAAFQLAFRDDHKVVDIALASGYESHEAFSRAFKKHFYKSPFEFRKAPDWDPWHTLYEPVLALRTKIMNETAEFNVAVIDYPQTPIAVMEHRGSPNLLGSTIHQFIAWRKRNHLPPGQSKTFNLLYDDPSVTEPDNFRFDIGCSVDHPVKENDYGVVNKVIPAGKCAVVRHIGSDDGMGAAVHYLYSTWLRDSGFELRDFPIFLERVSFFPDVPEKDMITDIYLPIH